MTQAGEPMVARKTELRLEMIELRKRISVEERTIAAAAIADRVEELLASDARATVVSAFLPIGEELDPRPAMVRVNRLGRKLCLPVMVGKGKPLVFRTWKPGDELAVRQWGIREPLGTAPVLEPDVLLMPLLAFDEAGGRLGYGGGYYDRTLAALRRRRQVRAVGLAYDLQRVDSVPCLDYDERLDCIVTPTRLIECRRPA